MKLEPCPFCGGESYMEYVYYEGPVAPIPRCKNKDCIGYSHLEFHDVDEVAIAAWNTRPIEAKLREQIAELERSLDAALDQYAYQVNYNVELEQWQREAVPSLKWEIEKYHQPHLNEILEMVGESIPHVKPIRDRIAQLETLIKQAEEDEIPSN